MSASRNYSPLESVFIGGVPVACTFLYDWRIGIAWFVFFILAGSRR